MVSYQSKNSDTIKFALRYVEISEDRVGQRIDNFLRAQFRQVPKSRVYRLLRKGEVRVNKGRVAPEYKLQLGDQVRIPPLYLKVANESLTPSKQLLNQLSEAVLYEDDGLIILNKPPGLAVHGGSGVKLGVIEALRQLWPNYKELELVHRLDRDTSGCLMIAKKRSRLRALHAMLREGKLQKTYYAIVQGTPKSPQQINQPLRKFHCGNGERRVEVHREGQTAKTTLKLLESFGAVSLVAAKPITGRTHQLRVHLAYIEHPIAGDSKYGVEGLNKQLKSINMNRLCLHAHELRFICPKTAEKIVVSAPLDPIMERVLTHFRQQ